MISAHDNAKKKYEEIRDHLVAVQGLVKDLGRDYYWPSRIDEGVFYVLKDATEALEELK